MTLRCFVIGHRWTPWVSEETGVDVLSVRTCRRCLWTQVELLAGPYVLVGGGRHRRVAGEAQS